MADRKSLFSRFWPATASRRTVTTQITASPPAITNTSPTVESKPVNQTNPNSATSPTAETSTDQPTKSPSREVRMTSKPTATTSTNPIKEPKTTSPSRATIQSPSSSKPASPYRRAALSRSPPQPSSPSRAAHQARRGGSQTSQISSTPKRASQPHSPSRVNSRYPNLGPTPLGPKGTKPSSPSKESSQPAQGISNLHEAPILASKEVDPKPATSQQESQMKEEVKSESFNGQTLDWRSSKHDETEAAPSQSSELGATTNPAQGPETPAPSESLESSAVNGGHERFIELNAKPEETKDVKEVVQATNTGANEETKKEVNDSPPPKSGSEAQITEKAEIPSKPDQMHGEKQEALDTKEIIAASLTDATPDNTTASQPKKRSTSSSTHNKSSLPNGGHVSLHKNIKNDMSTFLNQMAIKDPKIAINDKPVSVITLAGENRGASMQMESDSSKREGPVHIHRSYKINPDESAEATTDGEGSSEKTKSEGAESTDEDEQPTEAYVNNNAQGINNSIVFHSSITEGNPGVHMVLNHVPKEAIQSTEKTSSAVTQKAEINMACTDKLTYQPTVKRRCLRGLFLETSDSDPENPEMPRRHGCRVGCQQRDKENNIDVL